MVVLGLKLSSRRPVQQWIRRQGIYRAKPSQEKLKLAFGLKKKVAIVFNMGYDGSTLKQQERTK